MEQIVHICSLEIRLLVKLIGYHRPAQGHYILVLVRHAGNVCNVAYINGYYICCRIDIWSAVGSSPTDLSRHYHFGTTYGFSVIVKIELCCQYRSSTFVLYVMADESFRVSTNNVTQYGSTSYMEFNAARRWSCANRISRRV